MSLCSDTQDYPREEIGQEIHMYREKVRGKQVIHSAFEIVTELNKSLIHVNDNDIQAIYIYSQRKIQYNYNNNYTCTDVGLRLSMRKMKGEQFAALLKSNLGEQEECEESGQTFLILIMVKQGEWLCTRLNGRFKASPR